MRDIQENKGFFGWWATNHVAANLLMLLIIVSGIMRIFNVKIEVFPELSLDAINVMVPYRGATPTDAEQGVCLRIEEAVAAIDGVKRITSTAAEGAGSTFIEVQEYADVDEVLDDVKAAVDRITTFPVQTEKPIVMELKTISSVINIVVYGDVSEKTLRILAERIRDDLTSFEEISQVKIKGVRPYEIAIEVSEETLRRYGLSFDELASIVRNSSLDLPAGSVKTQGGEILVRTEGQRYVGPEFEEIIVISDDDGTVIRLRDIAQVKDAFEDNELVSRFDGQPAAYVNVYRLGDEGALEITKKVREYIEENKDRMPKGVSLSTWQDESKILKSRIDLLVRNARMGLILVFICLLLFLNMKLAFWVTMGIPISFLGAFFLMPFFDVSINMISLFALIMSLGLVVDDAIVVGENIFEYKRQGLSSVQAAIRGAREMSVPVVLAVLTTVFAFVPLAYTLGLMGKILRVMPVVVVCVLATSLVESLLILPAHLSGKVRFRLTFITKRTDKINAFTARLLDRFVQGPFARAVEFAVRWRYVTIASAFAILLAVMGFIIGGHIKFRFLDKVEADQMIAVLTMPQGTPFDKTKEIANLLEEKAKEVCDEYDALGLEEQSIVLHIATTVGSHPMLERGGGPDSVEMDLPAESHLAEVVVELLSSEERKGKSEDLMNAWRDRVGDVPGVSSLFFYSELFSAGDAISVELSHDNFDTLLVAADRLKEELKQYSGIKDIADSFEAGKQEIELELNEKGRTLGLTLGDLGRQVRQGFYGEEVQRIQRGRNDIRVMLRYPKEERKSLADVENMRIRLPDGTEIPFNTVAKVRYGSGFASIRRVDRRRVVTVTADVDSKVATSGEINNDIAAALMPTLQREFPRLKYRFTGEERERAEALGSLKTNFLIALMAIYGLLAVQFRSYSQPAIVMTAIPFGLVGAVIGHLALGYNLTILSLFGLVALSGVVVNDSLILIDLINRERAAGFGLKHIVRDSATRRFRPIMLTTLTTFFGLFPMMLEKSLQAKFLIPMAISLAFGVMFATLITLFLVPSLYMVLEDVKNGTKKLLYKLKQ